MTLVVKTYLTTMMPDGHRETWLSGNQATTSQQGPNGYQSVADMRKQLRDRFEGHHSIEDINDGVKLVPKPGFHQAYAWQEVTLEART